MYEDTKPCAVCGAEVTLRARRAPEPDLSEPVGPTGGVVGSGDPTVDERTCTNPECPTHTSDGPDA